ncbi:MAG: VCBS repeat-containing protein [Pseudomonadales bacterium]|nr:VCBS repeat-containing protein [Pseudomonadales bacterium]
MSVRMGEGDQSNSESKALYKLGDLDGDGITDLVTLKVKSEGVFNKQTTYEMHRGVNGGEHVRFEESPFSFIRSEGIQYEMEEKDFNQDGQLDVVTSSVRLGLTRVLTALITGSIGLDLQFYQMKDGRYPEKPNITRRITATFNFSTGDVFFPSVLIGDVDGDGLADLMVQEGSDELRVYPGRKGEGLFERDSVDFRIDMPADPDLVQLVDLNRDGKQDVLLQHEEPPRIVVLLTRGSE